VSTRSVTSSSSWVAAIVTWPYWPDRSTRWPSGFCRRHAFDSVRPAEEFVEQEQMRHVALTGHHRVEHDLDVDQMAALACRKVVQATHQAVDAGLSSGHDLK